jgi:hypothetical protein
MTVQLLPQHQRTIARLVDLFGQDPRFPAMIVGGSVARGRARDDSDVDVMFIATEEEFSRRKETGEYHYCPKDLCDYPGGYVDGKIISMSFLQDVADHGSEPARAAFVGAFPAYSHVTALDELLARLPVYPDAERSARMEAFYSHAAALQWFMGEAEKRSDTYLLAHAASDLVLFGGRLLLAYNRILYPYHKWFMTELRQAPDMPAGFFDAAETLLLRPSLASARHFLGCINAFRDWGVPSHRVFSLFVEQAEWNWLNNKPSVADW